MQSSEEQLVCPMCGYQFDPTGKQVCSGCPLQRGCQLVCCPQCGYQTVDLNQSKFAQFFSRLMGKSRVSEKAAS